MAQFARPSSDIAFALLGGYSINTTGNRYQNIDETTADTADYVYSQNNPGGSGTAEFGLSAITSPGVDTGHVLRIGTFQIDEDGGAHPRPADTSGTATALAWELRQGATLIESGNINPGTETVSVINLSSANVANITNYADLRVFLNPSGGGGSPSSRRGVAIYFIELETPDAGGTQYNESPAGSLSFTGSITKAASRALTASLSFTGSVAKQASRALTGSLGFSGDTTKETARAVGASLTFSTSFSANLTVPETPALIAIHIHPE